MISKLTIALCAFAFAAVLLPQIAFAADSRPVCIYIGDPRVCEAGELDRADVRLQAQIDALSHTYPAAAQARTPAAQREALNASPSAAASAATANLQARIAALSATYPSTGLAPARELSEAELQYHRETTARMDLMVPAASAKPPTDALTSLD